MKIENNLNFVLIILLFSTMSVLTTTSTISLFTSAVYAQENQTTEEETKNQIPEAAKGPTIPSKGYLVEEIRDGMFWITDGSYNTIFLVTDEGVVAVDAPP